MANHKSAIKRIRQNTVKRLRNKYYHKSARTAIKLFRAETNKEVAVSKLAEISSVIDKLAKRNIIHKNKASNLKSKLTRYANSL